MNISLKTKMALAVSLLFIVFSVAIGYFSISYFENKYKQSLASQQYALACAIANNIDNKLILLQKSLVAASEKVTPAVIADAGKAQRFVDERVTLHSLFDTTIFLLDKDGTIIAESPVLPERRVFNLAFREYYKRTVTTGKPVISAPYTSSLPDHRPVIMLTAPVFDSEGKLAAILCGGLRLLGSNLLSEVSEIKIGTTGYVSIATSDRIMIQHPDKSRLMKIAAPPGVNKLFDRAVAGFEGSGETINSRGIRMLVSHRHLRATNWMMSLYYPVSEAYAPMYKTRQYLLLGIAAGTLAILAIAWLAMKRLTAPLVTVTRQVVAMGGTTEELRLLSCRSADEIGTLVTAFNRMVTAQKQQQEALRESENNFRTLAEAANDGMLVIASETRFVFANQRIADMMGYPLPEFLALGIKDIVTPEALPSVTERIAAIIAGEEFTPQYETSLVHKNGTLVPAEVTSALTFWRGMPADLVILRDISERKRTEKVLYDSYTLLQKTFASLNEAVFIVETSTRNILDYNDAVEAMFGYTRTELIGANTSCLHLDDEMSRRFGEAMLKAYEDHGYFETIYRMKRKDGMTFDSEHFVTPISDDSGRITSHVCVVRDISERKQAEEQLRQSKSHLIEAQHVAHVGSWEVDVASQQISWSEEMFTVTGRDPALGPPTYDELLEIIHPDDRQALADCMRAASCEGQPYQLDSRRIAPDGSIHWMSARGRAIVDEQGKIVRLFGTVLDITERKQVEEKLRESEEKFRNLVETTSDLVWEMDEHGVYTYISPRLDILGYEPEDVVGKTLFEFMPPEEVLRVANIFTALKTAREAITCLEITALHKNGRQVVLEKNGRPFFDGAGNLCGYRGIDRNITERKHTEEQIIRLAGDLQRRAADLATANRELETFNYTLSHDLKAPLAGIYISVEALMDNHVGQLDETGRFFVESIYKASRRIEELLEAMLLLAQVTRSELKYGKVDLSGLALEILLQLRMEHPERKVDWLITPDLSATGDPRLLRSALENLFGNAWKYTQHNDEAHIEFGVTMQDGAKVYFVKDNGAGFSMEEAQKLFQPFQRLHRGEEFKGTGVGLATVQRIINRHGGRIWGRGEVGKGATFSFTLGEAGKESS